MMTLSNSISLFLALFLLALAPAPSVYMVIVKTSTCGLFAGLVFITGLVLGDIVFILFALYGLSALAESNEILFQWLNYLGGFYLCWLGYNIWKARNKNIKAAHAYTPGWRSSLLAGLLITLSDPRAVIFYVSFLPVFIDLNKMNMIDSMLILVIATMAVGGAKLLYALVTVKLRSLTLHSKYVALIDYAAAAVMTGSGIFLILR